MGHPADGTLRRMIDEPMAVREIERLHADTCPRCRQRVEEISTNMESAERWMRAPRVAAEPREALARLHTRIAAQGVTPRARRLPPLAFFPNRLRVGLSGAVTALGLAGALVLTPGGSWAQNLVTVFQPTHVVGVQVTSTDLRTLNQLSRYGTFNAPVTVKTLDVNGPREAASTAGMSVAVPRDLPSSAPHRPHYAVIPSQKASFTFSAAKAASVAAREGKHLPPMPRNLDGSTLEVTSGTAVVATYGAGQGDLPALVIGQMKAPVITAKGVRVRELEEYLLSLPGISPGLAAQIRALGDPTTVLPIPVLMNREYAHDVTVQGVHGLAVGDNTGIASGVVWQKRGIVYGVGGPLGEDQVLQVAAGLSPQS